MTAPGRTLGPAQLTARPAPEEHAADRPAVVDGVDVDALAAAVRACPAVDDLSPGPFGTVGTYLPGRRVPGVVVRAAQGGPTEVEVHVVAVYGPTMATVGEQVHAVITTRVPAVVATVAIDDVATPP